MKNNQLEITLNPEQESYIIENLDLEIEYLKGEREELENGTVRITMDLSPEKIKVFQKLAIHFIAKPEQINLN